MGWRRIIKKETGQEVNTRLVCIRRVRARARVCLSVCVCPHPLSVGLILLQSVGVAAVALAPALFDFLGLVHTIDPVG